MVNEIDAKVMIGEYFSILLMDWLRLYLSSQNNVSKEILYCLVCDFKSSLYFISVRTSFWLSIYR